MVNFHPHSNLFKWNNGDLHLFHVVTGNTTPSNMLFDPTLDRHLVQAVNAVMRELGTAARDHQSHPSHQSVVEMGILYLVCQIKVASVHLKQTADIAGWPAHWFANLAMDLNQLNSLILVTVLHAGYTPPLPVCYHAYLRHQDDELHIPLVAIFFQGIHSRFPKTARQGIVFPGLGFFFFKLMMAQGLWPLPEAPIADHLNGHIEEQVNYCIKNIWKYANVVNSQG
ncbi:hypothetical protein F5J12DRAFT_781825 [Pisolithus orientalis]|uniref:uncharacterized protein n=1 Tax=Pisolithus orientalis TaxID=936130 RepID=UPI00222431B9|nr:uncharacterized protein F5J12DRAFT_781825 [Pisolithus orientalis]KAI6010851.1 hypothetical protein F5J12DRAFT_781825 [Pisolithus orientalis]